MKHKAGWYFGKYKAELHENCYGFIKTGYWYAGGPEKKPVTHRYWGLVWAGKYTFGVGRIKFD